MPQIASKVPKLLQICLKMASNNFKIAIIPLYFIQNGLKTPRMASKWLQMASNYFKSLQISLKMTSNGFKMAQNSWLQNLTN